MFNSCASCLKSKSHTLPCTKSTHIYDSPLELVFVNVWGPAPTISSQDFQYYISFVVACTNYNWIFPLSSKAEVYDLFIYFKTLLKNNAEQLSKNFNPTKISSFLGLHHFFKAIELFIENRVHIAISSWEWSNDSIII